MSEPVNAARRGNGSTGRAPEATSRTSYGTLLAVTVVTVCATGSTAASRPRTCVKPASARHPLERIGRRAPAANGASTLSGR